MVDKRTPIGITAKILCLASTKEGLSKTRIMLGAGLTSAQINQYLKRIFEARLLEYVPVARKFRTSTKGYKYLKSYYRLAALLDMNVGINQGHLKNKLPVHGLPKHAQPAM